MKFLSITVALLFFCGSTFATEPLPTISEQINAIQNSKANRTAVERKMDPKLLMLTRESAGLAGIPGAPHLKSNVHCQPDGRVLVDLSAQPSDRLKTAIQNAGGDVIYESLRWESLRVCLPPAALHGIAAREDVKRISRTTKAVAHTGSVTSEGDKAHRADVARTDFGVDGTGIKVGVISDSADFSANSISLGDLPASFTVLAGRAGSGEGEGTAMSEIVHDLAPGAEIFFASAVGGKAFFADSIVTLRAAGCNVIVDDISYPNEWQFQDDEIGKAINQVVDDGAVYLSSSGNEGSLKRGNSTTWEGDFSDGGTDPLLPGGSVHSFGAKNYNTMLTEPSNVVLQWSDEYTSSANDYDLFVLNAAGTSVVSAGDDTQDGDDAPMEFVDAVQPGQRIVIWKSSGAAARYLRISATGGPIEIATAGQTIGHAATAKCICVASSPAPDVFPNAFTTSSLVDDASSDGPHRMFYNPDGSPITPGNFLAATNGGILLQTPAITGADGGVTSLPPGGLNPFYGTSAAAPHCAAIAALVLSKNPTLSSSEVRTILETSCLDIEDAGFDVNSGNGILMPELALEKTLTPQEVWRKLKFDTYLANGIAAPLADPDHDGLTNLLEYSTGSEPRSSSPSPLSNVSAGSSVTTLNYLRNPAATDVQITFEHSATLLTNSWANIIPTSDTLLSTSAGVELRRVVLDNADTPADFVRVKVTAP